MWLFIQWSVENSSHLLCRWSCDSHFAAIKLNSRWNMLTEIIPITASTAYFDMVWKAVWIFRAIRQQIELICFHPISTRIVKFSVPLQLSDPIFIVSTVLGNILASAVIILGVFWQAYSKCPLKLILAPVRYQKPRYCWIGMKAISYIPMYTIFSKAFIIWTKNLSAVVSVNYKIWDLFSGICRLNFCPGYWTLRQPWFFRELLHIYYLMIWRMAVISKKLCLSIIGLGAIFAYPIFAGSGIFLPLGVCWVTVACSDPLVFEGGVIFVA